MTASLSDILTTQKNGVVAINGLNQSLRDVIIEIQNLGAGAFASTVSPTVLASTTQLIVAGTGRIFAVSIPIHSGASHVEIYNSATVGGIAATNLIYRSLASTSGSFTPYQTVNLAYTAGIVIKTDAGMNCCVAYTPTV